MSESRPLNGSVPSAEDRPKNEAPSSSELPLASAPQNNAETPTAVEPANPEGVQESSQPAAAVTPQGSMSQEQPEAASVDQGDAAEAPNTPPNQTELQANQPESVAVLQQNQNDLNDFSDLTDDEKKERVKEYLDMLKSLYQQQKTDKLAALLLELKALEPGHKMIAKWEKKLKKLKEALQEREVKERMRFLSEQIKSAFEADNFDKVSEIAKELDSLDPGNKLSRRYLKKIGKETDVPEIKKAGFFVKIGSLFRSKPTDIPAGTQAQESQKEGRSSQVQAAVDPIEKTPQGNLFTNLFSKKPQRSEKSIIDTIVKEKAAQEEEKKQQLASAATQKTPPKPKPFFWLKYSRVFFHFTLIFVILSGAFLYIQTDDTDNRVLGLFGISNQASQIHVAQNELDDLEKQEADLLQEIALYQSGYQNPYKETIESIISGRQKWPQILERVNEIFNELYELNDFFRYIEANNFSLNTQTGEVSLTGNLYDPLGENFAQLVELERLFECYPACNVGPNSLVEPYFTDFKPFTNFVKTEEEDGRYRSSFRLFFRLNDGEEE